MSSHADTIREANDRLREATGGDYMAGESDAALDALLAENQQLERFETELRRQLATKHGDLEMAEAENQRLQTSLVEAKAKNQRLWDTLQELLEAAESISFYPEGSVGLEALGDAMKLAREALAGDTDA